LHVASAWMSSWGSMTLTGTRCSLRPFTFQGLPLPRKIVSIIWLEQICNTLFVNNSLFDPENPMPSGLCKLCRVGPEVQTGSEAMCADLFHNLTATSPSFLKRIVFQPFRWKHHPSWLPWLYQLHMWCQCGLSPPSLTAHLL
jgi:hypothetical protein